MDPSSITGMIGGIAQGGSSMVAGIYQLIKAKKLEKEAGARPEYTIPASQQNRLALAKQQTNQDYAGKSLYEQQIDQTTANQIGNIQDSAPTGLAALEATRGAYGDNNKMMQQSNIRNMNWKNAAMDKYMGALGVQAGYEDKAWKQNEWDRYKDYSNAAGKLNAAGTGNLFESVSGGNYGGQQAMGGMGAEAPTQATASQSGGWQPEGVNYQNQQQGGAYKDSGVYNQPSLTDSYQQNFA